MDTLYDIYYPKHVRPMLDLSKEMSGFKKRVDELFDKRFKPTGDCKSEDLSGTAIYALMEANRRAYTDSILRGQIRCADKRQGSHSLGAQSGPAGDLFRYIFG